MVKRKTIKLPAFRYDVLLIIGTIEECKTFVSKDFERFNEDTPQHWKALCYHEPKKDVIKIIIKDEGNELETIGSLAHEAIHATLDILNQRNIRLDYDNQEIMTYPCEYIIKEGLKVIKNEYKRSSRK